MSRKNQVFPKYVKLKIDPQNPPQDLWDRGCRRCAKCGTQWPAYSIFSPSPCCDEDTALFSDPPHMTWRDAVKQLLNARFRRYYDKWNDDVSDEALLWDLSIDDGFPVDESDLREGLEEIDRLVGERPTTSTE